MSVSTGYRSKRSIQGCARRSISPTMSTFVALAAIGLQSCATTLHGGIRPLRPLELATAPYQGAVTAALTGSLMYEGGCLMFRAEQGPTPILPIWPNGSIFNGTSLIFHEPAKASQPILLDEEIVIEGRTLPWNALPGYEPFQNQCGAVPFLVSKTRPAD